MNEKKWLTSQDPEEMIRFLIPYRTTWQQGGKVYPSHLSVMAYTERRRHLFCCACCRKGWRRLNYEAGRNAVRVAERYADGEATHEELRDAYEDAVRVNDLETEVEWAETVALECSSHGPEPLHMIEDCDLKDTILADLVRDIFGNPFRLVLLPEECTWNNGTIVSIARRIYKQRAYKYLPILADALEEAGCTEKQILQHLRNGKPHARGCWVLDLLLGKDQLCRPITGSRPLIRNP